MTTSRTVAVIIIVALLIAAFIVIRLDSRPSEDECFSIALAKNAGQQYDHNDARACGLE